MRPFNLSLVMQWSVCVAIAIGASAHAQDTFKAAAPPNLAVLRHTTAGAYFVAPDLKQKYEQLLARVERLKADVAAGNIAGDEALRQLGELEPQLAELRDEIEDRKVLVSPLKVQKQTEELLFDLGPERRLVVTADALRVVGWDGPQVKCVLEKSVLAAGDEPEEAEFRAMKLVHRHGEASEIVGRTPEVVAAEEAAFLVEKRDEPLTPEQTASRRRLVDSIQASYSPYRKFQGKAIDLVKIEGLTHEQGNRSIVVDVNSPGGEGAMGSDWRRSASLTVYVPRCEGIVLRGCLCGLAVEGVDAELTVTDAGSRDRDYDAEFSIADIVGPLAVYNVPLDRVESAAGDVTIESTVEYANTGTTHADGRRVTYTPPPRSCTIAGVRGDLTAWFSRVDLHVAGVTGRIDVRNESGDTVVDGAELAATSHRVLSWAGRVELQAPPALFEQLPVMAVTSDGRAETDADQGVFEKVSVTSGDPSDGSRRNWRGFKTPARGDVERFSYLERPGRVWSGEETTPGITLISRSGATAVVVSP